MTSPELVSVATDGPIATLTLQRPDSLNAISGALAQQLADAAGAVAQRDDVWVVILAAAGERAFCVGADLKERASFTLEDFHTNRKHMRAMFRSVVELPQPSIASVFGFALGGGFELALSCDLVVASEDAQFGLPEARVGLLPAGGGTQLLTRKAGPARAKEVIFTGRRLSAEEAAAIGIVTRVVSRVDLATATRNLAEEVCRSSPVALRRAKRAIDAALGVPLTDGLEIEHEGWAEVIVSDDRAEGIAAFNDKRAPRWSNR